MTEDASVLPRGGSPLVLLAPNALKESLGVRAALGFMREGVLAACPEARIIECPLADGGDGLLEALVEGTGGQSVEVEVRDPLGRKIRSRYGVLPDGTAVIEMALASGLCLLTPGERDPLKTSSTGTGELIAAALVAGHRRFVIGLGGSATNDGGMGAAQALGFHFGDKEGRVLDSGTGEQLGRVAAVDASFALPELSDCHFHVACDVDNPLLGSQGCASIFAPQKGASAAEVLMLDRSMGSYADAVESSLDREKARDFPGSGAAGGMGFFFKAFLNAELLPGSRLIAESLGLEAQIAIADLVLTCEGCLDAQTCKGKLPAEVARLCRRHGVPVVALAGILKPGWEGLLEEGLSSAFALAPGPVTLATSMKEAGEYLQDLSGRVVALFQATRKAHSRAEP
ncbi:MAG: glycerate kinase [Planctomycetes bacterium]|nr:glycerate kinase [Planctomycetota bacterium]